MATIAEAAAEPIRALSPKGDGDSFNDDKEPGGRICRSTFPAIPRNLELVGLPVGEGVCGWPLIHCLVQSMDHNYAMVRPAACLYICHHVLRSLHRRAAQIRAI